MLPSSVADHQFLEVTRLLSNHYIVLVTINAGSWVDVVRLLDDAGGPNHVGNVCDSPLMASVTDQVRAVFCSIFAEWFHICAFCKLCSQLLCYVQISQVLPFVHLIQARGSNKVLTKVTGIPKACGAVRNCMFIRSTFSWDIFPSMFGLAPSAAWQQLRTRRR